MQFENTETFKNVARSFAGECQAGMRYQMIAKLAMKEGLKTLSDAVRTIAKNETLHATQFFNKIIEKTVKTTVCVENEPNIAPVFSTYLKRRIPSITSTY